MVFDASDALEKDAIWLIDTENIGIAV